MPHLRMITHVGCHTADEGKVLFPSNSSCQTAESVGSKNEKIAKVYFIVNVNVTSSQ